MLSALLGACCLPGTVLDSGLKWQPGWTLSLLLGNLVGETNSKQTSKIIGSLRRKMSLLL